MAYNKNLYSSNVSALDAGIIYDQNQQLMQDEINAGIKDGDIIVGQADNLASDQNQFSTGEFIERTTGGDASLSDGDGDLILIRGSKLHEGYYAQGVELEIIHASGSDITVVIDDDTFLAQMTSDSGTFTTSYSGSGWSYNPGTYGITVTGTPLENDTITVTYQKEIRGTITMSNPQAFVSTGWNLYNHTLGYARVLKYHETYGFGISGTYTALQFSSTISGTKTSVTVTDGKFSITEDGYIWVTGGNDTDTAIWMTWSDWQSEANGGTWQAYIEDSVDFSSVMTSYFPYGLMAVEGYRDEIDFSLKKATVNVGRLIYNSTNLELAISYRTAVDYDENYIYYGLPEPVVNEISIANGYMAYDHGIEYFTDTEVEVYTQTLYGVNLKNRLERDVLTLSQQTLTDHQKIQVQKNIGINNKLDGVVNPNLLDNWYFVGGGSQLGDGIFPINQRGQTSYTETGHTIDRWMKYSATGTFSVNSSGIAVTNDDTNWFTYVQNFRNQSLLYGKTVTLSALLANGSLFSGTGTVDSAPPGTNKTVIQLNLYGGNSGLLAMLRWNATVDWLDVRLTGTTSTAINIAAIKLELGTTQTLAHQENGTWVLNEIPNYEEQLIRCKTSTADSSDIYAFNNISYNAPNPNLLDNWYFIGGGSQRGWGYFPINSREKTSYDSGAGIDRWEQSNEDLSLSLSSWWYISLTNVRNSRSTFRQVLDIDPSSLRNKTVTATVILSNGSSLYTGTLTLPSTLPSSDRNYDFVTFGTNTTLRISYQFSSGKFIFYVVVGANGETVNISALKLELGSSQTLAHQENGVWVVNELPNYEEQLIRCKTSTANPQDIHASNNISYNAPNPNLLDNWYFVGGGSQQSGERFPINQRGQTSYSGAVYGIDRWIGGDTVTVASGYITATKSSSIVLFRQRHSLGFWKNLAGKVVTLSFLASTGLATVTMKLPSSTTGTWDTDQAVLGDWSMDIQGSVSDNTCAVRLFNTGQAASVNLIAAKLELGSTQTLAHQENGVWVVNEIPNYAEELARCQRYCIALNSDGNNYQWIGSGIIWGATEADAFIPTPVTMRANPTVANVGDWRLWTPSMITPSAVTLQKASGGLKAIFAITGGTAGTPIIVGNAGSSSKLIISAEL